MFHDISRKAEQMECKKSYTRTCDGLGSALRVAFNTRLKEGDANVDKADETSIDKVKVKEEILEAIDDETGSRADVLGESKAGVELIVGVGLSGSEEDNAEFGQFPNDGVHSEPQWIVVFPQKPYSLQHSPSTYPIRAYPSSSPIRRNDHRWHKCWARRRRGTVTE